MIKITFSSARLGLRWINRDRLEPLPRWTRDPIWVLESNSYGYRVVWVVARVPMDGYEIIANGLSHAAAVALARRLRKLIGI